MVRRRVWLLQRPSASCSPPTTDATTPPLPWTQQRAAMPTTATLATNLPLRSPPSSIAEAVQRSPVLSSKVAEPPRQQRSGSVRPAPPPQPLSAPPQSPVDEKKNENGHEESKVGKGHDFSSLVCGTVDRSCPPAG